MALRIGFNARTFSSGQFRGFSRHTFCLIEALSRLNDPPEIHLFSDVPLHPSWKEKLGGFPLHLWRVRPHLFWEQVALPLALEKNRIQVFHSTLNVGIPRFRGTVRTVLTIHDLIDARRRREWNASHRISWSAGLSAEMVITVSRYSASEISASHPELKPKLRVVPNGVAGTFTPGEARSEVLRKYGASGPYFLYVGGFETRKNVACLLRAAKSLVNEGTNFQLVLAGDREDCPTLLAKQSEEIPGVIWTGYVPDQELVDLYRGACATVVPSIEEGFGFQVVEAMACGCPVLCSNRTSLPEVAGSAAALFDPASPEELVSLMRRCLSDAAWRGELRRLGIDRSKNFSWSHVAELTRQLYRSLVS